MIHSLTDTEGDLPVPAPPRSQQKCLSFSMHGIAWFFLATKLAGKFAATYFSALSVVQHKQITNPWLSGGLIWGSSGTSTLQNWFTNAGSGHKQLLDFFHRPKKVSADFFKTLCNHPVISLLIFLRLLGEAISTFETMSVTGQHIVDSINRTDGSNPNAAIQTLALGVAAINFIYSMAFTARADLRIYQKMSGQWRPPALANECEGIVEKVHKLLCYIPEYQTQNSSLEEALTINGYYQKAMQQKNVRAAVIRELRRESSRVTTLTQAIKDSFPHQAHHIIECLEGDAYRFSWPLTIGMRLTQTLLQAPFLYLMFSSNRKHFFPALSLLAVSWASLQAALNFFNTQGLQVDAMRVGLGQLSTPKQFMRNHIPHNLHGIFVSVLSAIPFAVFGAGQLLDLNKDLGLSDQMGYAMIGTFLLLHLLTYPLFVGERVVRKMPYQDCGGRREQHWINFSPSNSASPSALAALTPVV